MDKLKQCLPLIIQGYKEMNVITKSQEVELNRLWDATSEVAADQFVETATAYGVRRWEGMLGFTPKGTDSLEDRKRAILTQLNYKLPYTYRRLVENLNELCGAEWYQLDMERGGYMLDLVLCEEISDHVLATHQLLSALLPVNLAYQVDVGHNPRVWTNEFRLRFPQFQVASSIQNFGPVILLDGSRRLDGTWKLNQRVQKGLGFVEFIVDSIFNSRKSFTLIGSETQITTKNPGQSRFEVLSIVGLLEHDQTVTFPVYLLGGQFYFRPDLTVSLCVTSDIKVNQSWSFPGLVLHGSIQQEIRNDFKDISLTATHTNHNQLTSTHIIKDSMWHLDGSAVLDGTLRFNAAITEEEL